MLLELSLYKVTFNPRALLQNVVFLFSLTLKNPNRAIGGGALQDTRDVTIANRERLSDYLEVSDELLTLED